MKTEILTSELLKIIDPTKDGISYNGQNVILKLKELKKYVENPKDLEVFNITGDFEKDLYKNLALYIINSDSEKPYLINVDLNKPGVLEEGKGVFEYIKNIYKGEEISYINIDENGDNLLLIESQKLPTLSDYLIYEIDIQVGEDTHYATAASAFSVNPKKVRGQVAWQHFNSDRYSDLNFVMGKVREVFTKGSNSLYNNENHYSTLFGKLFEKINPELVNSDEFKLAMLDLRLSSLNQFFIERYNKYLLTLESKNYELIEVEKPNFYFINFSEPVYQEKILEQIKNGDIQLLDDLFSSYLDNTLGFNRKEDSYEAGKRLFKTMDFKLFINQPETIDYLLNQHFESNSTFKDASNQFTMASAYRLLDKERRNQEDIIRKCLKLASKDRGGDLDLDEDVIFSLDSIVFNEPYILAPIIQAINPEKFLRYVNKDNFPLLKDKEFLATTFKKVYGWKIKDWLYGLFDKNEIDKDFIKLIVTHAPHFFETLDEGKAKDLTHFTKDPEIIFAAINNGLSPKRLSSRTMKVLLLEEHDKDFELVKVQYLISTEAIDDLGRNLNLQGEELAKIKAKYHKPEFLFYAKDTWRMNTSTRERVLSKLKTPEEIFEVLNKVKKNNFKYEFLADLFYKSLDETLKKNKEITMCLLNLGKIKYSTLEPSVGYNADIALKCISQDKTNISSIPNELFTNAKFALGFAKMMDSRMFSSNEIPPFVTKFFENQEVTRDFETHLKEHLFYTDLQADLEKPNESVSKVRKAKI